MKKFLAIISLTTLIFITGCQNNTAGVKSSASDQSQSEKAASASRVVIKVSDDNSKTTQDVKETSVDLGNGLKVQGMVDSSIVAKSKADQVSQSGVLSNTKGMVFNGKALAPNSLQMKVGDKLMIFNNSSDIVALSAMNGKQACKDFSASSLQIGSNQTQNIELNTAEDCTIANVKDLSQKATVSVK